MAQCDVLSVLVCSRDVEPVPGRLRASWMAQALPRARILHMHRDIPQTPEDDPEFWTIWRNAIREFHPEPIRHVFGSDAYVLRLASELDAEPVLVDPDRLAFPVSGTKVRLDPAGNWRYLPEAVRPWYQKRVVLFGPESVGKSTLARSLGLRLNTAYVPEYGRTYDRFRSSAEWSKKDFVRIVAGHLAMRSAVAPVAGPILIEDTDPLLTAVWARMLLGRPFEELEDRIELADLYLLLGIDAPWIDDGTRYFRDGARARFYELCRQALTIRGARFVEIGGSWAEREDRALVELDTIAREPFNGR